MNWQASSEIKILPMAAICFCLFMFGLGVPSISTIFVLAPITAVAMTGALGAVVNTRCIILSLLLFVAACLHQFTSFMQDIILFSAAIKGIAFSICCYWVGYSIPINQAEKNEKLVIATMLSIALGFLTLSFGSVVNTGFPTKALTFDGGAINFIEGNALHKTSAGMYASLSICLFPIVLFTNPLEKGNRLYWAIALAFSVLGFLANMAMKNRTPVLALGLSTILAMQVYAYRWLKNGPTLHGITKLFLGTPAVIACIGLVYIALDSVSDVAFAQFQRGGMETPRYLVWQTVLSHFFDYFWGGRKIILIESYAHDLWLDILWEAGIPACLTMLIFHIIHFYMGFRLLGIVSIRLAITILGFLCSYLLTFTVEPVAAASGYFLWGSLVFFGMCARLWHMSNPKTNRI
jgi:hypothetical protein